MLRRKSILTVVALVSFTLATGVSAASISMSDAMQDFPSENGELKVPHTGQDIPATDQSVMNIGEVPVKNPSQTDSKSFQFEDLQPNFFQIDNTNLLGNSDRMMNEDGTTALIPFQL